MSSPGPTSFAQTTVIYGGSFNPPHVGHQMACLYLLEGLGAQQVWLVPAHRHPFAKPLAPFAARTRMCELLAEPFAGRVHVSSVEQQLGGEGRTYDMLRHLQQTHPNRLFALAVGADILGESSAWHRWDDIRAAWRVIVVGRVGSPPVTDCPVQLPAVSSTDVRQRLANGASIAGLVPTRVAQFIADADLYEKP